MRWNPFRRRRGDVERRDLGPESVSWPLDWLHYGASPVSVDQALRLAPVFAAGRLLASSVSSLPLQVYRRQGDERVKINLPPLFAEPSAVGTRIDWLFRCMTSLVYRGNAIGIVTERDTFERPTRVEWLDPDQVTVSDFSQLFEPGSFVDPIFYYYGERLPKEDLVHIPWFVLPGKVWGLSPIGAYASTVSTALSAQEFTRQWFNNGGVPPATFKNTAQTVDQTQADIIKRRLVSAIKTHEPIVYGADWDFTPISVSPQEAQFVETLKLGATEIANIYGIPPEMIGGETGNSMTYATVEQQSINFVQLTLLPWLTKLEAAFSALLPRGQYVKFNVDALIRSDSSTRFSNYRTAREIGLMNVNEARALEDMPPLPGDEGDDFSPLGLSGGGSEDDPDGGNDGQA